MGSVNKVVLVGHLGRDPEVKALQGGTTVCNFSIATSEKWTDKSGNKQEKTEWHRIKVFGKQAEACERYLHKGSQVYVEGRLETRKWKDKQDVERQMTEVIANNVVFLGGGGGEGRGSGSERTTQDEGDTGHGLEDDDIPF